MSEYGVLRAFNINQGSVGYAVQRSAFVLHLAALSMDTTSSSWIEGIQIF